MAYNSTKPAWAATIITFSTLIQIAIAIPPLDTPVVENNFERKNVPLLSTNNSNYKRALHKFISDWHDGNIGSGAPTEEWDKQFIKEVNDIHNWEDCVNVTDSDVADVYQKLEKWNVQNHLNAVNSHRYWLRPTQSFLEKIGITFSDRLAELVRKHDLSKYTHSEFLGYSVMFGDCQEGFKRLDDPEERIEWQRALDHHYTVNQHHPEYFFPKQSDGKREKSRGMNDADTDSGQDFLIESLIDMLAAKGERSLRHDAMFSVSKWMDLDSKFMTRYIDKDKNFVSKLLEQWKETACRLDIANTDSLQGHFDKRPVIN